MTRTKKAITLALIGGLLSATSGTAFAQGNPTYPPQPPTPPTSPVPSPGPANACMVVQGGRDVDGVLFVPFEGEWFVEGEGRSGNQGGCAFPGEEVSVSGQSQPIVFGSTVALEDQSFRYPMTGTEQLPAHWLPGEQHDIIVDVGGRATFSQPIEVLAPGQDPSGSDGTQVLGGSVSRPDGDTRSFTGFNLLLLVLWGIGLIGVGTMLVMAVWRRLQRRPVPLPATFRNTPPAPSPAEPPRLETADFVMAGVHEAMADRHQPETERSEPSAERPKPSPDIRDRVRRRLESDADLPVSPAEPARSPRVDEEPRATRPSTPAIDEEFIFSADHTPRR